MLGNTVNPVERVMRRYYVEFAAAMAAYVAVILLRHWLLHGPMRQADARWQLPVALLPLIPTLFVFAAIVRLVRRTDELFRRICIESLALAGGATALAAVTYGLIEGGQLPRLSAWWTYATFMVAWLVAISFVRRQYR
jgi:hypothetical protein